MKNPTLKLSYRSPIIILLYIIALIFSSSTEVLARVSRTRSLHKQGQRQQRSLHELSSSVHHALRSMAPGSTGLNAVSLVPQTTKHIHGILVEGSVNEEGEFDYEARSHAHKALRSGVKSLFREVTEMETEGSQRVLREVQDAMASGENELLELRLTEEQIVFYSFLTFMVVLAVVNIISPEDIPVFTGPQYKTGIKGSAFGPISPCNDIPMSNNETFGYLPILAGLFEDDFGDFSEVIKWLLEEFLELDETIRKARDVDVSGDCYSIGETCSLTSECCTGDTPNEEMVSCSLNGEQRQCDKSTNAGFDFVWEPFCLMWSESDDETNSIDTLAFKPQTPWPPVEFVPRIPSVLPLCLPGPGEKGCKGCDYHMGFPIGQVSIGPIPFKIIAKFDGIAVSWARPGKLEFDPGYDPEIWDGFRNILLPQIDNMNFWMNLIFEVVPLPSWLTGKRECETGEGEVDETGEGEVDEMMQNFFKLTLEMDLFVSIDTTDDDDNGKELAGQIGKNIAGENEDNRYLRELEGNDPCVIVTASATINIPLIGILKFGSIAGGYCTFPTEESGNRCTPSGAFLNIKQEFNIQGGSDSLLSSVLEGLTRDMDVKPGSGNSLGVFLNDGDFEAVVFRLEFPVVSLFGVTIPGAGRPIIHIQYVKGSEIERRRESILRTRVDGDSDWTPNCGNLADEDICDNDNDAHWANFGDNPDIQICTNILINSNNNPDKLMYYNRVLTAELKNPGKESDNYLLRPPDGAHFQTPARYDYSNDPDANVVILHMGLANFGNAIITLEDISLSLIFSDGTEPIINDSDRNVALTAYNGLNDAVKEIWNSLLDTKTQAPSGWHFPSLQDYLEHLPVDSTNISMTEIEVAKKWNSDIEGAKNYGLRAYIRIFCKIRVLFFVETSLGLIMMNYADSVDPSKWRVAAQFEVSFLGLTCSVSVTTVIDFDRRRHLHLEGEDYHRALANDGLEGAGWDVSFSVGCAPDSFCQAVVKFFEDVGEAVWKGLQKIGEFFMEDVLKFAENAIRLVGEWGQIFMGAIKDFANGIRDLFLNGAVGDVLNSDRVKAFNEDATNAVKTWSDGKFTLGDITAVGKLILGGVQVAADFIIAGVTDIVNAVGDFFKNAGKAIKKCFKGASWDEARHSGWRSTSECNCNPEGSLEDVKENCWCMDEFRCRVKIPQKRACIKKKLGWKFWKGCKTSCGGWSDLPTREFSIKDNKWRYPRFEARRFDGACREERFAKLAEAEKEHKKMTVTGQMVDSNFKSKFQGLSNFSEEKRRRRRLQGGTIATVNSVSFQDIKAASNGALMKGVSAQGFYDGSQLKKDSTDLGEVQREILIQQLDFSGSPKGEDVLLQFQRSATDVYLEEQNFDDEDFMARQPIILAPTIELFATSGTQSNPVELSCSGSLADAWSLKLNSAEPEVMRRRRTKEINHIGSFETVIDFPAESSIRQMILNGVIPVTIYPGGPVNDGEDDVFGEARLLLGTDGVGAFMDTTPKTRPANMDPSDYEWEIDVVTAEPLCDKLEWSFFVTATDRTGTSNPIDLHAYVLYGETTLSDAPQYIQTRCDSSSIGIEDLEYDYDLQNATGYRSFTPLIRTDNCPSPYVHLLQKEDNVTNPGTPCTTDYKTIERVWDLDVHAEDSHMNCSISTPLSATSAFPFIQTFTLGGLVDDTKLPATPEFNLQPHVYYVQKEDNASVATSESDFYLNGVPPTSECGLCDNNTIDSVFYNQTDDFTCNDEGDNTISIKVVNNIGIEVTTTATATVVCQTLTPTMDPTKSPTAKPNVKNDAPTRSKKKRESKKKGGKKSKKSTGKSTGKSIEKNSKKTSEKSLESTKALKVGLHLTPPTDGKTNKQKEITPYRVPDENLFG